jgi:hypothetical protein
MRLYPAPVPAGAPLHLFASEYGKWLAVELGLSSWTDDWGTDPARRVLEFSMARNQR